MEPRLFKRGNIAFGAANDDKPTALQGSHVFSNVEIKLTIEPVEDLQVLQWSHVFSNVEIFQTGRSEDDLRASMEPRLFKRGNAK